MRNAAVKGETPEKAEIVHRNDMINEILHIQSISRHLPVTAQELIFRDATALRTMKTSSISAHLYRARMIIESSRQHPNTPGQQSITNYVKQRNTTPRSQNDMTNDTDEATTP
jgi:hypothetical protein